MDLRTVRVPESMKRAFEDAERVVSSYFGERRDVPEEGTIEVFGERYVLVRAASLSVEFFGVVRELFGPGRESDAEDFARNILFDLAHAIGKSDARNFHAKMGLEDPIERLSAGPVHFAYAGWAFVDISEQSTPTSDREFFLLYDHPYSFESDAWKRARQQPEFPVCIMNAGYSSGWCEESFGVQLVSSEVLCRARGDEHCRFIMAHPEVIESRLEEYRASHPRHEPRLDYQIPDFFSRKRLEDELRRAHDGLERRVTERTEALRRANQQLLEEMEERKRVELQLLRAQKLEALGGLAGGIAHDFNNLLTAIGGYSELLEGELAADVPGLRYVREISQAAARATRLTRQLLVFSRQNVGTPRVVDLNQVARNLVDLLRRLIGEQIELRLNVGDAEACVRADPGQIEQILVNLAVNARDAMLHGGTLTVDVADGELDEARARDLRMAPGPIVELRVSDTGTGMDSHTLAHLFDPFFTTKPPGRGTGLGLATVYGITQKVGGEIVVASRVGEGSCFRVFLPRVNGPPDPLDVEDEPMPCEARARSILLVEDDSAVREFVRVVLHRDGYRVLEADSPDVAERLFAERGGEVDLLLTDVIMPIMSGPELARRLRTSRPDLKVIFMSGYAADELADQGLERNSGPLLQKPFTVKRLEERLSESFGRDTSRGADEIASSADG